MTVLKAPFPYYGGKSRIAAEVWRRFGDVPNLVEPFFGSGAVLLARPSFEGNRIETVNDRDAHLTNFWRALAADPDGVAYYADWPVSELDLHARGDWLYYRPGVGEWVEKLRGDPDFYDAKSAGWWVWFMSCWIGRLPSIAGAGQDVNRQIPHLGSGGQGNGVHGVSRQIPSIADAGRGVGRQVLHLGNAGRGAARLDGGDRRAHLTAYLRALAARLERVRVCCGDWSRVCGPSVTHKRGLTAVFLDPPYSAAAGRDNRLYSVEDLDVAHAARAWALENGDNPLMRIALCGYDGEGHEELEASGWHAHAWKTGGGYGNQGKGRGRANKHREVVWFSPHCLNPIDTLPLFRHNGHAPEATP